MPESDGTYSLRHLCGFSHSHEMHTHPVRSGHDGYHFLHGESFLHLNHNADIHPLQNQFNIP